MGAYGVVFRENDVNRLLTLPPRRHNPATTFIDRRFCLDGYGCNLMEKPPRACRTSLKIS
jgi:hypothetical protein